jgi:hypothetical protein
MNSAQIMLVVAILKKRFNNLSAAELIKIATEIIEELEKIG